MSADRAVTAHRRDVLSRRIRWFVAATISYNVIEAVVAIGQDQQGNLIWHGLSRDLDLDALRLEQARQREDVAGVVVDQALEQADQVVAVPFNGVGVEERGGKGQRAGDGKRGDRERLVGHTRPPDAAWGRRRP